MYTLRGLSKVFPGAVLSNWITVSNATALHQYIERTVSLKSRPMELLVDIKQSFTVLYLETHVFIPNIAIALYNLPIFILF